MVMYITGEGIREYNEDKDDLPDEYEPPGWFNLEFAAAFLATLFWVCICQPIYEYICVW